MADLTSEQRTAIVTERVQTAKEGYEKPVQQEIRQDYAKLAALLDQAAAKDPSLKQLAATAAEMSTVDHHDRTYDNTYNTQPEGRGIVAKLLGEAPSKEEAAYMKEMNTRQKEDTLKSALGESGEVQRSTIPVDLKASIDRTFEQTENDKLKITEIEMFSRGSADDAKRIGQSKTPEELNAAVKAELATFKENVASIGKDVPTEELQKPLAVGAKAPPSTAHQK